jgi:hypothetical protein
MEPELVEWLHETFPNSWTQDSKKGAELTVDN